jgi:hypothetical protein
VKQLALIALLAATPALSADVDALLRDRVVTRTKATGIVVAVVTPESTTFYRYGSLGKTRPAAVVVEKKGDRLFGHATGRSRPLLPLGGDAFRIDIGGDPINLVFLRDGNGRITSLLMYGSGQTGEGERQ